MSTIDPGGNFEFFAKKNAHLSLPIGRQAYYGFQALDDYQDSQTRSIAGGERMTLGLKADGTVVAAGRNSCGKCDVSGWQLLAAAQE